MLRHASIGLAVVAAVAASWLLRSELRGELPAPGERAVIDSVAKQIDDGNFRDALERARPLIGDASQPDAVRAELLPLAAKAAYELGQPHLLDELRAEAVAADPGIRLLVATTTAAPHRRRYGVIKDGAFVRGGDGGEFVDVREADRARNLHDLQAALRKLDADTPDDVRRSLLTNLRNTLRSQRQHSQLWKLQSLTDLETRPDYTNPDLHLDVPSLDGAPVDAAGDPLTFDTPDAWDAAASDGERLRWVEAEMRRRPGLFDLDQLDLEHAGQWHRLLGVQSLGSLRSQVGKQLEAALEATDKDDDENADENAGPGEAIGKTEGLLLLPTLKDDETVARLATGVRRFTLPEPLDFIATYKRLAKEAKSKPTRHRARNTLVRIFLDRMQYPRAAALLSDHLADPTLGANDRTRAKAQLAQIVAPRGDFLPLTSSPSGRAATVQVRFRNADEVTLTATRIDIDRAIADAKSELKSNPANPDGYTMDVDAIGRRLFIRSQVSRLSFGLLAGGRSEYLGDKVAGWTAKLSPRENHFDRITTIPTPLSDGGAYLLTAKFRNGQTPGTLSRTVVWISDLAIVMRPLADGGTQLFVADSMTGQPVADAKLSCFGRLFVHNDNRRKSRYITREITKRTDADGLAVLSPDETIGTDENRFDWLVEATHNEGGGKRHGWLGWADAGQRAFPSQSYRQLTLTGVTDRPIYRPGDTIQFHTWLGTADYGDAQTAAGNRATIELLDPFGETVATMRGVRDEAGGLGGTLELPPDAKLGRYSIRDARMGREAVEVRVEEYRKPEFEVTVETPESQPRLGEIVPVEVAARYYAGGPVSQGTVRLKVTRQEETVSLYPACPWDWLYGEGYIWRAVNDSGPDGFDDSPIGGYGHREFSRGPWGHGRMWGGPPPEVVLDQELDLQADGTVTIELDTAVAAELYGGTHRYRVTAEVTDLSRRTVTGAGSVLVAEQPFHVGVWTEGYGRVGQPAEVTVTARTPDGRGVDGTATLELLRKVRADDGTVTTRVEATVEGVVEDGRGAIAFTPNTAGIYDVRVTVASPGGDEPQVGAARWIARGDALTDAPAGDGLIITTDKAEYAPGDEARLLVTAPIRNAHVFAWTTRPTDEGGQPRDYGDFDLVPLDGATGEYVVKLTEDDQPNRFVEFFTIAEGRVHTKVVELYVPPSDKSLTVTVTPDRNEYRPGDEAEVSIAVTDAAGRAVSVPLVVSAYDRSVDVLAGGPDARDLRKLFWDWTRSYRASLRHNLDRVGRVIRKPNEAGLQTLGQFGAWNDQMIETERVPQKRGRGAVGGFFGYGDAVLASEAMPATAAPMAKAGRAAGLALGMDMREANGPADGIEADADPTADVAVRERFTDTAFWSTAVRTDGDGQARATIRFPDNLTDWSIRVWGVSATVQVGQATASATVSKDLLVRVQTPRFLTDTDEVELTATIQNKAAVAVTCDVAMEVSGAVAMGDGVEPRRTVTVPADGQVRVAWPSRATSDGEATVIVRAASRAEGDRPSESDGMKVTLPVQTHGMDRVETWSGVVRASQPSQTIRFVVPEKRIPEETRLELRVSPSVAGSIVDALPYLAEFPYGCTEQTLNRFLPAVVTQRTLRDLNLDLGELAASRLNPTERGEGTPAWQRLPKRDDEQPAVFDEAIVAEMVDAGVERLSQMQLRDGGWGWFAGTHEQSSPHTTAVVVRGLQQAAAADVALPPTMLPRGLAWLSRHQTEQVTALQNHEAGREGDWREVPRKSRATDLDAFVAVILADASQGDLTKTDREMLRFLYRDRTELTPYGLALLGVALHTTEPDSDRFTRVLSNLDQFLVADAENATAYLDIPNRFAWWRWSGDAIEANAWALKLFSRVRPRDPRTSGLATYLLNNRRHGTYWKSTRDTALAVEALAEYLRQTDELNPDLRVEVLVDGEPVREIAITQESLLSFDGTVVLEGDELAAGEHTVELRRSGRGSVYYGLTVSNFTLEPFIAKAGLEARVERRLWHLTPKDASQDGVGSRGQLVEQAIEAYDRTPLDLQATLPTGELVEVELIVETKNDYEYLLVEDFKAAGCEAIDPVSGYRDVGGTLAYVEFRDNRTALFLRSAPRGTTSLRYRLRTEQPGSYSALPAVVQAMYAPELRGNSDENKLAVTDGGK